MCGIAAIFSYHDAASAVDRAELSAIRDAMNEIVRRHRLTRGRIGYEGSFECISPSHNAAEVLVPGESWKALLESFAPSAKWIDATALLYELRATKTEQEIARLRVAHQVAGFGIKKFHE